MKYVSSIGKYGIALITIYFFVRLFVYGQSGLWEQGASYIAYPFLKVQQWITYPFYSVHDYVVSKQELMRERDLYKDEFETLRAKYIETQTLLDYQRGIAPLHENGLKYDIADAQCAFIMLKRFENQGNHFIVVDRGSNDGIVPNMIAVYKNCLIGRVAEVYPWYSHVILITDRTCKVPAYCVSTNAEGIHEGTSFVKNTHLNFISHLEQVNDGDMIFSSGKGMIFPRGLMVGRVVSSHREDLHHIIVVQPECPIDSIQYCYLINKSDIR